MAVQQTGQATGASCIARAEFEARQRAARTDETTYVVWGWRQGDGTLWQPNQRVIVFDPVCGFNNSELLISEVTFTKDNNGTLTELRVGPPDAYLPEPEDKQTKGIKTQSERGAVLMGAIQSLQRQVLSLIGRAVVKSINAASKCQTVDVELLAGRGKAGIEHLEPYGFTSRAKSGAEAVVLFRMAIVPML